MKVSVIFTTYNSPQWLEHVLWGFYYQNYQNVEIIVADDGSTEPTRVLISDFNRISGMDVKHVWQPDDGFQKCRIMNKALQACSGEYVIFTDGDCIPRRDFVETHVNQARKGYFLSGGYFKLPMSTSQAITKTDIANGNVFDANWLISKGLKKSHKTMKLTASGWRQTLFNNLTPTNATWNGHNASAWKEDILSVNGFDERMQYGGEDRELGERLFNKGLKSKQIRYSAICVHLDHERGYVKPEMIIKNKSIRKNTKINRVTTTPFGIVKA